VRTCENKGIKIKQDRKKARKKKILGFFNHKEIKGKVIQ